MNKINFDINIEKIKKAYAELYEHNRELMRVIEELKDGIYKDEEIKKLQEEKEKYRQDCLRGFPITEEQAEAIEKWRIKHESEIHGRKTLEERLRAGGAIGGKYFYRFIGTSLGVCGEIVCSECGQAFEFQELW